VGCAVSCAAIGKGRNAELYRDLDDARNEFKAEQRSRTGRCVVFLTSWSALMRGHPKSFITRERLPAQRQSSVSEEIGNLANKEPRNFEAMFITRTRKQTSLDLRAVGA